MPQENRDPVALAGADRAQELFIALPAPNNFDHIASASEIQARRAAWLARRARISVTSALLLSPLVFDGGASK
jgi:hypothetical protein